MKSYEIIRKAIKRQNPPRLPVRMGSLGQNDTAGIPVQAPEGWEPQQPGMDEWGCVWAHTSVQNMGQVKGHPLLSTTISLLVTSETRAKWSVSISKTLPTKSRFIVVWVVCIIV